MKKIVIFSLILILLPITLAEQKEFNWKGVSLGMIVFGIIIGLVAKRAIGWLLATITAIITISGLGLIWYLLLSEGGSLSEWLNTPIKEFYKIPWIGWQLLLERAGLEGVLSAIQNMTVEKVVEFFAGLIRRIPGLGGGG